MANKKYTFDDDLILIKREIVGSDKYGNAQEVKKERIILCQELSLYSSEFYSAATAGLKPEVKVAINNFEYEGEEEIIFKGQHYYILRTYRADDYLEITAGDKIG